MAIQIDAHEISQAFADPTFFFAYQPIVDLATGTVTCVEALVRWQHPSLGLLMPDAFLPLIHGADLSQSLTQFGIDQLLSDLPKLRELYGSDVAGALNLSRRQLADPTATAAIILGALERTGEDPAAVHIEVVEDATSLDVRHAASAFADLRAAGIAIVLDDFGTGASSLTALTEADYDGLKIDRSFVQGVVSSSKARSVIEAVVAFGRSTGTSVVAEGVETSIELQALIDIGCTLGQGYHFGRPQPLNETPPLVALNLNVDSETAVIAHPEMPRRELADVLEQIDTINPRSSTASFEATLKQLEDLDQEAQLIGPAANEARCRIGDKVTIAGVYNGQHELVVDWGIRTSRLAEQIEQWSTSVAMLAVVASTPWDDTTNPAMPVDALTRALQIRITKPMSVEDSTRADNAIGAMFATLGLVDQAWKWWKDSVERYADHATFGTAMCSLNLIELQLEELEGDDGDGRDAASTSTAIAVALLKQTLARLDANPHTPGSVAESMRCRIELVQGNMDAAEQAAEALTEPFTDIVSTSLALRALANLARAQNDVEQFLKHTTGLVGLLADRPMREHHDWYARRLHAQALLANGRTEESAALFQELLVAKQAKDHVQLATLFEWIRHKTYVNVQYDELFLDAPVSGSSS